MIWAVELFLKSILKFTYVDFSEDISQEKSPNMIIDYLSTFIMTVLRFYVDSLSYSTVAVWKNHIRCH